MSATQIRIDNVRLSYPTGGNLLSKGTYKGKETTYSGHFIIDEKSVLPEKVAAMFKTKDPVKAAGRAMQAAAKEKWGDKAQGVFKMLSKDDSKLALRDGNGKMNADGEVQPAYADAHFISATSKTMPRVMTKTGIVVTPENVASKEVDGQVLYPGCRVNVLVNFWGYDDDGRRINCSLDAAMFAGDDESLGGGQAMSESAAKDAFSDAFDSPLDGEAPESDAFEEGEDGDIDDDEVWDD